MSNVVDAFAKVFGEFLRNVKKEGFIRIIPLVSVDTVIASSLAVKLFSENGIDIVVSLRPHVRNDDPVLLLDLEPRICSGTCLSIIHGENKYSSKGGKAVISTTSSISSTFIKIVESYWITDIVDKTLALVGGIDRGKDRSKRGFEDIDGSLAEDLLRTNNLVADIGLRLWGWKKKKLLEMLTYTYLPYLPGLTGSSDRALEFLKNNGFDNPEEATAGDLLESPEKIKGFVQEIMHILNSVSKRRRTPIEVLGKIYYGNIHGLEIDLNDLYGLYLTLIAIGDQGIVNAIYGAQDSGLFRSLYYTYAKLLPTVVAEISRSIEGILSLGEQPYIRAGVVKRPEPYVKILCELGYLGDKPVVLRGGDGVLYTSYSEAIRTGIEGVEPDVSQLVVVEASVQ